MTTGNATRILKSLSEVASKIPIQPMRNKIPVIPPTQEHSVLISGGKNSLIIPHVHHGKKHKKYFRNFGFIFFREVESENFAGSARDFSFFNTKNRRVFFALIYSDEPFRRSFRAFTFLKLLLLLFLSGKKKLCKRF